MKKPPGEKLPMHSGDERQRILKPHFDLMSSRKLDHDGFDPSVLHGKLKLSAAPQIVLHNPEP